MLRFIPVLLIALLLITFLFGTTVIKILKVINLLIYALLMLVFMQLIWLFARRSSFG